MAQGYFTAPISQHLEKTPEGFLIARGVVVGRTGFQTYRIDELPEPDLRLFGIETGDKFRTIDVYRPASEVFSPEAMASLNGKPVTDGHPDSRLGPEVNPDNFQELAFGHVQNVRRGSEPLESGDLPLLADVLIEGEPLLSEVESGRKREISLGYTYRLRKVGNRLEQAEIHANHCALVPDGRAGDEARIQDSSEKVSRGVAFAAAPVKINSNEEHRPMRVTWKHIFGAGLKARAADAEPEELAEAAMEAVSNHNEAMAHDLQGFEANGKFHPIRGSEGYSNRKASGGGKKSKKSSKKKSKTSRRARAKDEDVADREDLHDLIDAICDGEDVEEEELDDLRDLIDYAGEDADAEDEDIDGETEGEEEEEVPVADARVRRRLQDARRTIRRLKKGRDESVEVQEAAQTPHVDAERLDRELRAPSERDFEPRRELVESEDESVEERERHETRGTKRFDGHRHKDRRDEREVEAADADEDESQEELRRDDDIDPEEERESEEVGEEVARAHDGAMSVLRALRPAVARSSDARVRGAFNTALRTVSGVRPSSGGSYGEFSRSARAHDASPFPKPYLTPQAAAAERLTNLYDKIHSEGMK